MYYKMYNSSTGTNIFDWQSETGYTQGDSWSGSNSTGATTNQTWGNVDLNVSLLPTNLHSGRYTIEYYFKGSMNKAQDDGCYSNYDAYLNNNSANNYTARCTIPVPEVTISGRPYAGIESRISAGPKSGTTI